MSRGYIGNEAPAKISDRKGIVTIQEDYTWLRNNPRGILEGTWNNIWNRISQIPRKTPNPVMTTFDGGCNLSGTNKWAGGVLAANGKIYGIPATASGVLCIDPSTKSVSIFGNLDTTAWKYIGGAVALNGMIYAASFHAPYTFLKINPYTESISPCVSTSGTAKYYGAVLATNGMIYIPPNAATSVGKINPNNDSFTSFGYFSGTWRSGCLAPNSCIYYIPGGATNCLKVDPSNDSGSTFGSLPSTIDKNEAGVLAQTGKIYGAPAQIDQFERITPNDNTINLIGSVSGSTYRYKGGILAPDGNLYFIPGSYSHLISMNPFTEEITDHGEAPGWVSGAWAGAVLAPNGNIYCIPQSASCVLEISNVGTMDWNTSALLTPYVNKF
mgnify:CR=1 FL=1